MSIAEVPRNADERVFDDTLSDEPLYEVIDGLRVELLMSALNDYLASRLTILLGSLVLSAKLGHVVCEVMFELPVTGRSRRRRPDVAFVSFERWAENRRLPERGDYWPVAPDLAIEFVSPNDEIDEMMDKLNDYFEGGVRQVWVVHPRSRVVHVFDSAADVRGVREPAEIGGGDVLPGLRIPVAVMFPPRP